MPRLPHPRAPLRTRAAIVAVADGLWLDLDVPGYAGHLVADIMRAGLDELQIEIVRWEQARAIAMLLGETLSKPSRPPSVSAD